MTTIKHKAIMASAGSGKTFQLAHRYIQLMAYDEDPERIIALTFSRKAAGEIFDSIVQYLHEAAASPAAAAETAAAIGKPELKPEDFNRLLRRLLDRMNRLHVGTLDSFIVGILRAFPAELGIPLHFTLGDNGGTDARRVQQEVLGRIFNTRYADLEAQHNFHEAFKQATFGREEKGLMRNLDQFISKHREAYQQQPDGARWGRPEVIWPEGSPWLSAVPRIEARAEALLQSFEAAGLDEKILDRWITFTQAVARHRPGTPWGKDVEYLFNKLMPEREALPEGVTLKIDRKPHDLDAEQGEAAMSLLQHLMWAELTGRLKETQGIFQVLDQYEEHYQQMVQRQGFLTFTDAAYLLSPGHPFSARSGLSRSPDDENRMFIDYRLDARLDHWLLDEFQDTSDLQWDGLQNLADEILQDGTGRRSFFYVGDVKQAIYGWRGGNPHLFEKILRHYESVIELDSLSESYRSCAPVIDAVNRVFDDLDDPGLPPEALAHWRKIWKTHAPAAKHVPEHGCVEVLETERNGKPTEQAEARYQAAAARLNTLRPLDRGMTVAFLLRSNDAVADMAEVLRETCPDMAVVQEGRAGITDNPVVSVLQSLVHFAAHPGDTLAWRHLHMSPLAKPLKKWTRSQAALALLQEIQQEGFQAFLDHWGAELGRGIPLDDYGRLRLNDLLDAAGAFDQTASRDSRAFLDFLEDYQVHEAGSDQAIRVMTIHQAKGLGFDVVFLPDLDGHQGLASCGDLGLCLHETEEEHGPDWILQMPRRKVSEHDEVLHRVMMEKDTEHCFDALCLLYVALTRAKRAMYLVMTAPPKSATAIRASTLVRKQLCDGPDEDFPGGTVRYRGGEADWLDKTKARLPAAAPVPTPWPDGYAAQPSTRKRLQRGIPSATAEGVKSAENLFGATSTEAASFGTALHDLFEQISFYDEVDLEAVIQAWRDESTFESSLADRVIEQFRRALQSEDCRKALFRPSPGAVVWREKQFEAIVEDRWYTGVFDRVVYEVDASGHPVSATILDYKSNQIRDEAHLAETAEKYRPQLVIYRQALAAMLGLDLKQINLLLLFSQPGLVVAVD